LTKRDAIGLTDLAEVEISAAADSRLPLMEVPMA